MTERTIAFLGLGIMGAGMAHRLIAAGFDVVVWNRSPDKAAPLAAAGARVAATPAAAAQGAGVVVAMLADDVASRSAWLGADGALAAMAPGTVAIESSTLTVEWVRTLEAEAAAAGVRLLDAPVSGSRQQAEEEASASWSAATPTRWHRRAPHWARWAARSSTSAPREAARCSSSSTTSSAACRSPASPRRW
ncbi:NAD(P)-binding domain-containing protein [Sphingomonas sp. LR60]|uniref:NAD(P)-binding domain-containing protein n=1 Tax=Sphingomonas sp. LR60 TaxID=3050233 RepID=UPI002FDF5595